MNELIQSLEKPEKNICIYGLLNPETNELFYIGQTIQGFARIREHFYKCQKRTKNNTLTRSQVYIYNLKKQNKIFKVIYLEYLQKDSIELDIAEKFWISYFKMIASNLLNDESGGKREYKDYSKEIRNKISIKTKLAMNNPTTKEKCRQNLAKNRKNMDFSKSEEQKRKISLAQEKKVIYIQDNFNNIYRGIHAAARALNIHPSLVSYRLRNPYKIINGIGLKKIEKSDLCQAQ